MTDNASESGRSALLITNQAAGGTGDEAIDTALAVLRTRLRVDVEVCATPADIDGILARHPHPTVIVAGGDGSLHTLVGALWRRGETGSRVVGLLPLGTGNDFARGQGLPLDPGPAAHALLDGEPQTFDLIVDDRGQAVVNAVHAGVGATAARAATPAKPLLGRLAFPAGAVWAGLTTRGWPWRVEVDGVPVSQPGKRVLMVAVANGRFIAGGGATIGPAALPHDGLADITVSHAVGAWQRLRYALRLRRGTHPHDKAVTYVQGRRISLTGEDIWLNADGEVDGPASHRTWTVEPAAWRLLVPKP
ncbi:diacylglycerol/lipid kinase family protein [Phytohabitans aurantiacus]|nr:diacylglycerol kinase family protein [Phytohabitans aurantiacus]